MFQLHNELLGKAVIVWKVDFSYNHYKYCFVAHFPQMTQKDFIKSRVQEKQCGVF